MERALETALVMLASGSPRLMASGPPSRAYRPNRGGSWNHVSVAGAFGGGSAGRRDTGPAYGDASSPDSETRPKCGGSACRPRSSYGFSVWS